MTTPRVAPRNPRAVLRANPYCVSLHSMYTGLSNLGATSWNQIEDEFLSAMSAFDSGLPTVFDGTDDDKKRQSKELSAAIQNGKGDWFNNVIAYLLEKCSGVETLYVRRRVPGLIIPEHNLDGVYPGDETREIEFLLEAKMMGTPKHANSPGEKTAGRAGSADTNKRVKETCLQVDRPERRGRSAADHGRASANEWCSRRWRPVHVTARKSSSDLFLHGRARAR